MSAKLTQWRLKEVLHYNPDTGAFTWTKCTGAAKAGSAAGCVKTASAALRYCVIRVDSALHRAHRLAWLYMTGDYPSGLIDHVDGNGLNNRWCNLRQCSHSENQQNRVKQVNNRSGYLGVSWAKYQNKWQAQITVRGDHKHLGFFEDPQEAHKVYLMAKSQIHTFQPVPRDV